MTTKGKSLIGITAAALLCLSLASPASAVTRVHKSSFGTFTGQSPRALTVDQSNGDVYAVNFNNNSLDRFTAAGAPKNYTDGPGSGTNQLPIPTINSIDIDLAHVAIDRSGGPADGDIYVTNGDGTGVLVFSNTGAPETTITAAATPGGAFDGFFGVSKAACGVAVDQQNGDVYVSDAISLRVYRYSPSGATVDDDPSGGDDYTGAITTDITPCGLAADDGKLYVADTCCFNNSTVELYNGSDFEDTPSSPTPTVISNRHPSALAVDPTTGELYVDEGDQVQVFDSTGDPTYVFADGDLPASFFTGSFGIAVKGGGGKAYVSDPSTNEILVYPLVARLAKSSFGTFTGQSPRALTVDQSNGDVYAVNFDNNSLDRFTAAGAPKNYTDGPGSGTNQLPIPTINSIDVDLAHVAIDRSGGPADGNIYVTDGSLAAVQVFANTGAPLTTLTGSGTADGAYSVACGVGVDQQNGDVYVTDAGNLRVYRYSLAGSTVAEADYSGAITTDITPCGLAADDGKLYVADTCCFNNSTVELYNGSDFATGPPPTPTPTVISNRHPSALAVDPSTGDLYVDEGDQVQVFDSTGDPTYVFADGDLPASFFTGSFGIAVKGGGGKAYVSDPSTNEILVYPLVARLAKSSFGTFTGQSPRALTVDQSNGDVYAVNFNNNSLDRFTAAGAPKNYTDGPGSGTNQLPIPTINSIDIDLAHVAIDRSGGPADGDIYVTNGDGTGVLVFSNTGAPETTITAAATPGGAFDGFFGVSKAACGVAVDQQNGDVYVSDAISLRVYRYSPSGATVDDDPSGGDDYTGAITTDITPCGLAADDGKLYVADTCCFNNSTVELYNGSDFEDTPSSPTPTVISNRHPSALAVDPTTGELYVDEGDQVQVFDSTGDPTYVFADGDLPASFFTGSFGIAVKGGGGKAYVADPSIDKIRVYGPFAGGASIPPPAATTGAATAVGLSTATLEASVNPRGGTISDCHFDYVTDADFQATGFTGADTAPCDPTPAGDGGVPVSADLTGLAIGTDYQFRVVATNSANATAFGAEVPFSTLQAAFTDPPTGTNHHTNATLHGHIEPNGDTITDCRFDFVDDAQFQVDGFASANTVDCDQPPALPIDAVADVSAFVNDLTPGAPIHYRLHLATAANGDALAAPQIFAPAPSTVRELTNTIGSPGSGDGQLSDDSNLSPFAQGVAVDQDTGDVYVADTGNHRLAKFDADGNFVSTWGWGVSDGSPAFQVCTSSCQAGISGSGLGQFNAPRWVTVDNSGGPSAHDLYVSDGAGNTVTKFSPSGALAAAWGTGGQVTVGQPFGVAVDSAARLTVVAGNTGNMRRLDGATGALIDTPHTTGGASAIALESAGTYLVLSGFGSAHRFDLSGPDSDYVNNHFVSKRHTGNDLAVDPTNGDLYLSAGSQVRLYSFDPAGNVLQPDFSICTPVGVDQAPEQFGEGCDPTQTFGAGDLTNARGIGVNGDSRRTYVTDSGQLKIFETLDLTPPTPTIEDPSDLTATTATLKAKVDPEGVEVTDCHFSYLTDADFQANPPADRFAGAATAPCSPNPGSGSGDVAVSADVSALDPATAYHVRIQAANATPGSTVTTTDRTFTTRGSVISRTRAHPVTDTDAVLRAQVNPQSDLTTYHFEYGTDTSYGTATPESSPIGGTSIRSITQFIDGLSPGTTYHFRIVSTNQAATLEGADATFTTAGDGDSCPNADLRPGYGFALPDCRAYEQASPTDKHGAHALTGEAFSTAAADGSAVTYVVTSGLPGQGSQSNLYPVIARRSATAWLTNYTTPQLPAGHKVSLQNWDRDLSTTSSWDSVNGVDASADVFYIGDTASAAWSPAFSGPQSDAARVPAYADDPLTFVLDTPRALTPDVSDGTRHLYRYDQGDLAVVGRVPALPDTSCADGGPSADDCVIPSGGTFAGPYSVFPADLSDPGRPFDHDPRIDNAISADGSRVVFTESGTGRLYLRDGDATVQVNASQATTADPNGPKPAAWVGSSRDGGTVYFTSCERLTDDSTAVSAAANSCHGTGGAPVQNVQGSDLYAYGVDSGELTDLTADPAAGPLGAAVQRVLAVSDDGRTVYFAANGSLAPGAPSGDCVTSGDNSRACELYVLRDGAIEDVGTLGGGDIWGEVPIGASTSGSGPAKARIAADGTLMLQTTSQLTSYDNTGPTCVDAGVERCTEVYRYRPGDAGVTCVSCDPDGDAPVGRALIEPIDDAVGLAQKPRARVFNQTVSADGDRLFFQTPEALVPADTNGADGCDPPRNDLGQITDVPPCSDVYEWVADGADSCTASAPSYSATSGGCLYLISSGKGDQPSWLVGASASGDDAFIRTTDRLVPQDTDDLYDVYTARVGGGLASQHPPAPDPCIDDDCQGPPTTLPADPGTGTSNPGSGNAGKDVTPPSATKKNCKKIKIKKKRRKCKRSRAASATERPK